MKRILVKICGLTRPDDVKAAVAAGADAVGFVFAHSPRRISIETAVHLCGYVPKGILRVGLFLDQCRSGIDRVVRSVPLDVLQFHGTEEGNDCGAFKLPYLKAVVMKDTQSMQQAELDYPDAMGLLLDSHEAGKPGGSGKVFDWSLSRPVAKPVWLAGGLNAGNVSLAVSVVKPYAVDVSSGVETAPGVKDAAMIAAFINSVRKLENERSNCDQ